MHLTPLLQICVNFENKKSCFRLFSRLKEAGRFKYQKMSKSGKTVLENNRRNLIIENRGFVREPHVPCGYVFHPGLFERKNHRQQGHCNDKDRPITCMAVNQSKTEVLVGSADHAAYTFCARKAIPRKRLYAKDCGHFDWLTSCLYLRDTPITAGVDGKLCIWERCNGSRSPMKCQQLVGNQGSISSIKSFAEKNIVSAGYDGSLCVWNVLSKGSPSFKKIVVSALLHTKNFIFQIYCITVRARSNQSLQLFVETSM